MHARNTGLFKGKDLAKGEEVFIENLPCEILPVTVEPSGGMSARIMARFSDGKMERPTGSLPRTVLTGKRPLRSFRRSGTLERGKENN